MGKIKLNDKIITSDNALKPSLWARTQIIGGYGLHTDENGISQLDEVVFETENLVPIGGVQYALEVLFGVKGKLQVPTLNDSAQIGAQSSTLQAAPGSPFPAGQKICLFGIGKGGAASNNITPKEVKYNETNIIDQVPFRYTTASLGADATKYYGKKTVSGKTAYYLKKFDKDIEIKHLEVVNEDWESGNEINSSYFSGAATNKVVSYAEAVLVISSKDVKEWAIANGGIETAGFNSIALYTAAYDSTLQDYANIRLFSKLNIRTEPLDISKDMEILYRVFGA